MIPGNLFNWILAFKITVPYLNIFSFHLGNFAYPALFVLHLHQKFKTKLYSVGWGRRKVIFCTTYCIVPHRWKEKPFLCYSFRVEPLFFTRGRFMFFLRIRKKICQRPLQLGNRTENDKTLTSSIKQNTPKDRKVKNNHFAQKRNLCGILMFSNGNSCVYYLTTAPSLGKRTHFGFLDR